MHETNYLKSAGSLGRNKIYNKTATTEKEKKKEKRTQSTKEKKKGKQIASTNYNDDDKNSNSVLRKRENRKKWQSETTHVTTDRQTTALYLTVMQPSRGRRDDEAMPQTKQRKWWSIRRNAAPVPAERSDAG